ncbi:MAG: EF2563 family selenium-dependent molybdenum hydroxylase system protein [Deltaproteobacteria bacterium]|nr:EF2563 family selenium-dependent molybdenum hydroxylase system protein [Deltaproteobacteria bacterium]
MTRKLKELVMVVRGAGDLASGVAHRLWQAGFRRLLMVELTKPLAVRRAVSFSEAVYDGRQTVEGVTAVFVSELDQAASSWSQDLVPVLIDPDLIRVGSFSFDVLIEATLAKRNSGIRLDLAPLVIALGPGFSAGVDAHFVVETNRGHHLGRVITSGPAEKNTGIPGNIGGYTADRVFRAPVAGVFETDHALGDTVQAGETVAWVNGHPIPVRTTGVLRGLIRPGVEVTAGLKVGDVDPRGNLDYLNTISEKARAVGGAVLEAILRVYNV